MSDAASVSHAHLELPSRLELPLFTYGPLQPGQPAYERVLGGVVAEARPATVPSGALRIRDGLPLLDPEGDGGVVGHLLIPHPGRSKSLYEAVCTFEPRQHYRWLIADVLAIAGGSTSANVLQGRHPERGSTEEFFRTWTAGDDPGFGPGMHAVRQSAILHGQAPAPAAGDGVPFIWDRFFGLQAAYLLLWSLVDRYTAIAYGPAEDPLARAHLLGADPLFRSHVIEAGVAPRPKVADSRDPTRSRRIRDDGTGAVYSWEAVRTTLGHPGRTATTDFALLRRSLVELHDSFRLHLVDKVPELTGIWTRLDLAGEEHGWLLRPGLDPAGL